MPPAEPGLLAEILVAARRSAAAVDASMPPWTELDYASAVQVGRAFVRLLGAEQSPHWKLGAVDRPTQLRLGVDGPICAPLDPDCVTTEAARVTLPLAPFIEPRFEAEIGICVSGDSVRAMPCVEIADSRFARWTLPTGGVIADAALQGAMLFGSAVAPHEHIEVDVWHAGVRVGQGSGSWSEALDRLSVLPARALPTDGADAPPAHVATGALTMLFPCALGEWVFDFGRLGTIIVDVVSGRDST